MGGPRGPERLERSQIRADGDGTLPDPSGADSAAWRPLAAMGARGPFGAGAAIA